MRLALALLLSICLFTSLGVGTFSKSANYSISAHSSLILTNATTNVSFFTSFLWVTTNSVAVSGGFSITLNRGNQANHILQLDFTDVTNLTWFVPGPIYYVRGDMLVVSNSTGTNIILTINEAR